MAASPQVGSVHAYSTTSTPPYTTHINSHRIRFPLQQLSGLMLEHCLVCPRMLEKRGRGFKTPVYLVLVYDTSFLYHL